MGLLPLAVVRLKSALHWSSDLAASGTVCNQPVAMGALRLSIPTGSPQKGRQDPFLALAAAKSPAL
jgi:hypothetical protein